LWIDGVAKIPPYGVTAFFQDLDILDPDHITQCRGAACCALFGFFVSACSSMQQHAATIGRSKQQQSGAASSNNRAQQAATIGRSKQQQSGAASSAPTISQNLGYPQITQINQTKPFQSGLVVFQGRR
jgi:hypothetical protein